MSIERYLAELRRQIDLIGDQRSAAKKWGISESYLSEVLNGRRDPSQKMLKATGWRRVAQYIPEKESAHAMATPVR